MVGNVAVDALCAHGRGDVESRSARFIGRQEAEMLVDLFDSCLHGRGPV